MVLQAEQNMDTQFNKDLTESYALTSSTALSLTELHKHYLENEEKQFIIYRFIFF